MKKFKYNRWLICIIIIGLLAALAIDVQRHNVEKQNMTVDMAIDYEGLLELAEREGVPPEEVLQQAKDAGITSLAVYETTFKKLNANGKAAATPGSSIIAAYHTGKLTSPGWRQLVADGRIKGTEVYVTGHDAQTFKEVQEDIVRRLGSDRVQELSVDGEKVLAVKANYEAFEKMNLGMPTDEMKAVNAAGFYVLARPSNYNLATAEDVKAAFSRLDGIKVSEVVFSGSQVLGAPDALAATVEEMKSRNLTLGMIEDTTQLQFYKQDGLMDLAEAMDYKAARLYSIAKDEMPKLKLADAVERWSNTDQERNIRINHLRIYEKPSPNMSLLETNMQYFKATHDILARDGFSFGPAGVYVHFFPEKLLRIVVMLGVVAAGVLYLSLVIPNFKLKHQLIFWAVLAVLVSLPLAVGNGGKVRLAAALVSANVFPALAVIWQLDRIRGREMRELKLLPLMATAAAALFATGVLSYVGAAYLSASLADVRYLLEIDIFRGIKLTFIMPLILVAIAFLQRFDIFDGSFDDADGVLEQVKKILAMPVTIKALGMLFAVLVAAVIFVARSGHTMGMPVPGIELKFRAFLEKAMYARPRSKELLLGHPAFMLAAMAWQRKWPTMVFFALVLVATIGQGSMVETFAHMRTPIFMSFMRGIGGIILGAGIGACAMAGVQLWQYLVTAAKGRMAKDE